MTTTSTANEAVRTVNDAITRGVEGDVPGGVEMLIPLMKSGVGTLYALAAMLAEMAGPTHRPDTSPAEVVFASRFTVAWANREHDRAESLFGDLYARAGRDGEQLLVDAVTELFRMAVSAARREEPTP